VRLRRSFMPPRPLVRALCVVLGAASVGACGGGPDGTVGSAISLDAGGALTASPSSTAVAGTLLVSAQSTIAEPLASGAVLLSNEVVPRSGAIESAGFPGLLRWEPSTRRVTHAVRLEMPLDALRATLGEAPSTAFRSEIADARALPDGGALVQFDLFADAPGAPARRAASVLARLHADLSVAWTRAWAGGQRGRMEVRGDAVATTGESLMRYDGQGRPVSQEALGGGGFVLTLASSTEVIGVAGGFVLRGTAGGDRIVGANAASGWHAAVGEAAGGGAVAVGWGQDSTAGGSFHPVAVRLDASGRPVQSVQLGVATDRGAGLTDIARIGDDYYVVGTRALTDAEADWFVCRLGADLSVRACITGRSGRRQARATVRADALGERLYIAGHADGAPALVLGPDLDVRFDPGTTVEGFAITRDTWHASWAETALAAPGPAGRVALAVTGSSAVLPVDALDTRALGALSSTPPPAAP
jgi:hypothetical protein